MEEPPRKHVCTLDIDNREGLVLAHTEELSLIQYEKKQLTVGDYIVRADDVIIAVIERKSLVDFAASIKDSRMDNTGKLLALRAKTACRVIYIIECPKGGIPLDDSKKFGNIPFGHIRSAIYHLMLRDNIMILWTIGTVGTANELVRFVRSTETLLSRVGDSTFLTQSEAAESAPIDLSELTKRYEKSDHEIVRMMWSCFSGIGCDSADDYINRWSLRDIITSSIPRTEIAAMKGSNRRTISTKVVNSLCAIGPILEERLLACVPGISKQSAKDILRGRDLRTVITSPLETISAYSTGKLNTSVGVVRATRILALFEYKAGAKAEPVDNANAATAPADADTDAPAPAAADTDADVVAAEPPKAAAPVSAAAGTRAPRRAQKPK